MVSDDSIQSDSPSVVENCFCALNHVIILMHKINFSRSYHPTNMTDSKYFTTTKKGEIFELKSELNSEKKEKKREAVKKVSFCSPNVEEERNGYSFL